MNNCAHSNNQAHAFTYTTGSSEDVCSLSIKDGFVVHAENNTSGTLQTRPDTGLKPFWVSCNFRLISGAINISPALISILSGVSTAHPTVMFMQGCCS